MQKQKWCNKCCAKTMHEDWKSGTVTKKYSRLEKFFRKDKRKVWQCKDCGELKQ